MTYATVKDVQARMTREMTEAEEETCKTLLADASALIDAMAPDSKVQSRVIVCSRMVARALGDGEGYGVPVGASQGSMSALGYTQSWTIGNGGGAGELYLSKIERRLLGIGNAIGSRSPVENLAPPERPKGECCRD